MNLLSQLGSSLFVGNMVWLPLSSAKLQRDDQ